MLCNVSALIDLPSIQAAAVGVFGYVMRSGQPNACAVTPYVVDGCVTVTSTLALVDKAAAVRRDPRVVLLAGAVAVSGRAAVTVDPSPRWFDAHIRDQELAKYPPARSILAVPGHRRLFPWYVGRVIVSIDADAVTPAPGDDHTTLTWIDADGAVQCRPVARPDDLDAAAIPISIPAPDGRATLLVHEEDEAMTDLRQLVLEGRIEAGNLIVERRRGNLTPSPTGLVDQLRASRQLARRATANRARLATWPTATT